MTMYNAEWVMGRKNRYHGLLPLQEACRQTGFPQSGLKIIHVAGTNGKGSTVNFLKDILVSQGFRVGTFTSPHLTDHRDRLRINGEWIPEDLFLKYLNDNIDLILEYDLGMFEIDLLISLLWFRDEKPDYVIMEAGLGGRLDNTNIFLKKELEIITTISYDHTNVLGERIQQIAFEKAGIITPYSRCIGGYLDPHSEKVIRLQACRRHASYMPLPSYRSTGRNTFVFLGNEYCMQGAQYQKANACMALYAAKILGIDISSGEVKEAVSESMWAGRFETVSHQPDIILDGAHNEEGIRSLIRSFSGLPKPLVVVFSALKDKPGRKMAELLNENCDQLYMTRFDNPRMDKNDPEIPAGSSFIRDWKEAVRTAEETAGKDGTVVIAGSLYLISLVRAYLNEEKFGIAEKIQ